MQSKFDAGYKSPYLATKDAMGDVTMAIISCTCVFMAVFIPVTFMGGTSGVFYTQFGITMATAVGISMISALTLCPALCAIMMRCLLYTSGDMYVIGGYDPEFDEEALDSLVATVARFPFSVIKGKVYGDVSMKDSLYWGSGWLWDDTPYSFQPYLSPLMLNKGCLLYTSRCV